MSTGHLLMTPLRQRLNAIRTRCQKLIRIVADPYRPELHYMRGPGPKWRARHRKGTDNSVL